MGQFKPGNELVKRLQENYANIKIPVGAGYKWGTFSAVKVVEAFE